MTKPGAAVFVHGILGSAATWSTLFPHLQNDPFLKRFFDLETFEYASPVFSFNPLKRIPDFGDVASRLAMALRQDNKFKDRSCLVLIGHSQGGLIIQRLLVDAVRAGRADQDLAPVSAAWYCSQPLTSVPTVSKRSRSN